MGNTKTKLEKDAKKLWSLTKSGVKKLREMRKK